MSNNNSAASSSSSRPGPSAPASGTTPKKFTREQLVAILAKIGPDGVQELEGRYAETTKGSSSGSGSQPKPKRKRKATDSGASTSKSAAPDPKRMKHEGGSDVEDDDWGFGDENLEARFDEDALREIDEQIQAEKDEVVGSLSGRPSYDSTHILKEGGIAAEERYLWRIHQRPLRPGNVPGQVPFRRPVIMSLMPPTQPRSTSRGVFATQSVQHEGRSLYRHDSQRSLLRLTATSTITSGALSVISQRENEILIASNVPTGTRSELPPATWGENPARFPSDNRIGSVTYGQIKPSLDKRVPTEGTIDWTALRTHLVPAVWPARDPRNSRPYQHYMSCIDAKFLSRADGSRGGFVTVSTDGHLRIWANPETDGFWDEENEELGCVTMFGGETYNQLRVNAYPSSIILDPETPSGQAPLFVVGCARSGEVHIQSAETYIGKVSASEVVQKAPGRVWKRKTPTAYDSYPCFGRGDSRGWVFAGTDCSDDPTDGCAVVSFNTRASGGLSARELFADEHDPCQYLTTDFLGQRLAIIATDRTFGNLKLKIYDVRAPRRAMSSVIPERNLDASDLPASEQLDCSIAHFSPDGIYFAVGRERNLVQVLDSRFATHDLFVYKHDGLRESLPEGDTPYGISAMEWLDAEAGPSQCRNVLVSGGDDGAVRVWDTRRAQEDTGRNVLSEASQDCLAGISAFSLGNVYKGEIPLVVGDVQGRVQVYGDTTTWLK